MAIGFKGAHFPQDIILTCIRWYVAYLLNYRHIEELMQERGVAVDHATVNRWVVKYIGFSLPCHPISKASGFYLGGPHSR